MEWMNLVMMSSKRRRKQTSRSRCLLQTCPPAASSWTTASRTRRTGRGADIAEKDEAESLAIDPNTHRGPREVTTVSFDYAFVGDKGEIINKEQAESDENSITILAVRDSETKSVFGHVVPQKGIDSKMLAVDAIVNDILWLGRTKVVLKSDNEPLILKLLIESLRELRVNGLEKVMSEN